MKTKDSKETARAFLNMFTKNNWPKKVCVDERMESAGEFWKLSKAEGLKIYFALRESIAAFAEHTIPSLKNRLYHYMEDYEYKCIHNLPQLVTKRIPEKNARWFCYQKMSKILTVYPFCTAGHCENFENPSLRLDIAFASPSMTYPSLRVISHSLHGKFLKLLQFFPENLQYTQQMLNRTRLSLVSFIKKTWTK